MAFRALLRYGLLGSLALILASSCLPIYPSPRIDLFDTTNIDEEVSYPIRSCAVERAVDPTGVMLDMAHMEQTTAYTDLKASRLCWATNIAMVSTYLGNPRSICQVASYMSRDGLSCCRLSKTSPAEEIARCNKGAFYSHIRSTFHQMGIYVLHTERPLAEDDIRLELSNGRPVILQMNIDGEVDGQKVTWQHVIVIAGFKDKTFFVHDPSDALPGELTHEELLHGKGRPWTWYASWYHFSYRQDGCNPRFTDACDCK